MKRRNGLKRHLLTLSIAMFGLSAYSALGVYKSIIGAGQKSHECRSRSETRS